MATQHVLTGSGFNATCIPPLAELRSLETTLNGLQLVVFVSMLARVLCVIPDPMLLKLRQLLLENAGFSVLPVSSVEQAIAQIREGDFDLLIIGCDVVGEARELLLRENTQVPTVVLYCGNAPEVATNAVCDCLEDPKLLVNTVQSLLLTRKKAPPRKGSSGNGFTRIALERGIAVSVCTSCYRFITYGSREDELQTWERAHVCAERQEA